MPNTVVVSPQPGDEITSAWGTSVAGALNGIQGGVVTLTAAAGNANAVVVFPRPFTAAPVVVVGAPGSSFFTAQVAGITPTQCTVYVRDIRDAQAGTGALPVQWLAMGVLA